LRILFLSQWFDPEPFIKGASFVSALIEAGAEVEVATAFPNYPGGKIFPGYRIRPYQRDRQWPFAVHRLPIWPSHDRSAFGRVLNYVSFFLSSLTFGLLRGRRYDIVYVYHPPMTSAAAAALFTAVYRRPFIVEIQDLWPDTVIASGMVGKTIPTLLDRLCHFVYRRAALIITQSKGMTDRLVSRGVPAAKLRHLYNWSTYEPAPAGQEPVAIDPWDENAVNFIYGGNLGQAQSLSHVIDAFILAHKANPRIHLHLFGNGIERDDLAAKIEAEARGHVFLHDPVSRQAMDRIFDRADALVLNLNSDALYDITIPSKLQHYLSVGHPILAGLSGEAAGMLVESGSAIVCPPQHVEALAKGAEEIAAMSRETRAALGAKARAYYAENLTMRQAVRQTLQWTEETLERSR